MSHSTTVASSLRLTTINQRARNRKGPGNHCSHSTAWGLRKGEFCSNLQATATHKTSRRCVANRKLRAHRSCLLPFLVLSRHYANDCPCTAVSHALDVRNRGVLCWHCIGRQRCCCCWGVRWCE